MKSNREVIVVEESSRDFEMKLAVFVVSVTGILLMAVALV